MSNLPMELPICPSDKGHGQMMLREQKRQTVEQLFCGTWYDCPNCSSSVLFPSMELQEFLKQFKQ